MESFSELTGDASYLTYETGDCAGKPAGYFGDPRTQCRNYVVCQDDGRLDEFRCPEFTRFNNQLLLCDWHWMVDERCNPVELSKGETLVLPLPFDPIIKVADTADSPSKNGLPKNYAMRPPPVPPVYVKPERPTEEITIHVVDLGRVEGRNSGEPRRQAQPHKTPDREGYDQIYDPNNKSPYLPYAEAKYRPLST
ncbi:hypothetical protein RvY_01440 [Ramazzottius varieornatus]|uniref:Chitin-binding type-2 domain-containing protein n=1 Tax=Ramazzottius varieornatus TaxID=947166 RepID=A0A1D1UNF1_RAMVA|nr:hypothetical protein RvY_01440 [Ramazzottius varieornatus]